MVNTQERISCKRCGKKFNAECFYKRKDGKFSERCNSCTGRFPKAKNAEQENGPIKKVKMAYGKSGIVLGREGNLFIVQFISGGRIQRGFFDESVLTFI